MARRGGLAVDPMAEMDAAEQQKAVEAAVASGSRERDLDTDEVAPDPENPESRLEPKPHIVAGIKEIGQLHAGMVQPLDNWIAQGGDGSKLLEMYPKARYVIVFGHGRWAACRTTGRPFRAVVNTTIDDMTDHIVSQLQENLLREGYSVIEEARAYQRLVARKLSQHEIGRRLGVGQPQVNKRLKLLSLPEEAQAAVVSGALPIEAALVLAKIAKAGGSENGARVQKVLLQLAEAEPDAEADTHDATDAEVEDRRIERQRIAKRAVSAVVADFEASEEVKKKRAQLTKAGTTVIDNPADFFKDRDHGSWSYLLRTPDEIAAAQKTGKVVAHVASRDRVDWYTTEDPEPKPEPAEIPAPRSADETDDAGSGDAASGAAGSTAVKTTAPHIGGQGRKTELAPDAEARAAQRAREERERQERQEREEHEQQQAAEDRAAACVRIAGKAPARDALTLRLTRRVLAEDPNEYADIAQHLALTWLKAAAVIDENMTAGKLFYGRPDLDLKTATRVAYVYDLALCEARVRSAIDGWDEDDADHIERLKTDAGYQPSEWEQANILGTDNDAEVDA